jgi:hypothetical protein
MTRVKLRSVRPQAPDRQRLADHGRQENFRASLKINRRAKRFGFDAQIERNDR